MTNDKGFIDLFALAQRTFLELVSEFKAYGLEVESSVEPRRGAGLFCSYDLKSGHLYLALPEPDSPLGRVQILFLKALLNVEEDETLFGFISFFLPRALAHELGHYLRHKFGTFTEDLWHEEQVANQLGNAVTQHRMNPEERDAMVSLLRQTLEHLAREGRSMDIVFDSYDSPLRAFEVAGILKPEDADTIFAMNKILRLEPETLLEQLNHAPQDICGRLLERKATIEAFNRDYTSDAVKYFYYQLGWMLVDLESREHHYVDEFAQKHLNRKVELLPLSDREDSPSADQILAYFRAHQETASHSAPAGRYFYKRYRSLLLSRIRNEVQDLPGHPLATREARRLLESWEEENLDPLFLLRPLVPQALQSLLPGQIGKELDALSDPARQFRAEADQAIWRHVVFKVEDKVAENTLSRLQCLDQMEMFRRLPVEVLMGLIGELYVVKARKGETLIWEKSLNDDLFILMDGRLEVFTSADGQIRRVGTIRPGHMFGEMAFITGRPRSATVRAAENSQCFVLKSSTLRAFALKHPTLLFEIAKSIAEKLEALDKGSEVFHP
jgi:hypothetical protein